MSVYLQQITTAIRATRFRSSAEACWFGKPANLAVPRRLGRVLTPVQARACVLTGLQDQLYTNFYCRAVASPSSAGEIEAGSNTGSARFVERLSGANGGAGFVEPGWEVRHIERTTLTVSRNGLALTVRAAALLPPDVPPSPGLMASLRLPKEFISRLPGFYLAMGNRRLDDDAWKALIRLYWNVTPDGAVDLMRLATCELNTRRVPFQFKVHTNLARGVRSDGAVLYLHKPDYAEVCGVLEGICRTIAPNLRAAVPALTKRLAPGVGLAEDPGNGLSFGEHRCRLLAEGLLRAHELGKTSDVDRLHVVEALFADERISLETPYLNPGSADAYGFESTRTVGNAVGGVAPRPSAAHPEIARAEYVDAALRIGRQICQDARWSSGRCSWMGATTDSTGKAGAESLGPHLYSGTSGVALFLAELHAATGDDAARSTALGAIEQALWKADGVPAGDRVGLFAGWIGVALAAARIGIVVGEDVLLERARDLVARLDLTGAVRRFDHISGSAGAITGLLALSDILQDLSLIGIAARLGETILSGAVKTRTHWSWPTINAPREANLTGLSHGAAGIACALIELFGASGDHRFRRAAELGFAYERHWFAGATRNWPDLCGYPRGVRRSDPLPCGSVWCHGAPGIALSRLRAFEITGDERWKSEALVGLQTAHSLTATALQSASMNFSLCHGLAGNAEVLMLGAAILRSEFSSGSSLAADVADFGLERYARTGKPWPCGAAGPTPALMLGLAGMGYFYLRLADSAIPSILLIDPGRFAARMPVPSSAGWNRAAFPV